MKINKLLFRQMEENRCTGRSTALALKYIAYAIEHPNTPIRVRDHVLAHHADMYLLDRCENIVVLLALKHFKFNRLDLSLQCNLWVETDD